MSAVAMTGADGLPLRVTLVRLNHIEGTATLVRSDGNEATFDLSARPDPTSSIVEITWVPGVQALLFETNRADRVVAEMPSLDDMEPVNGRPVIYLDQNHWSTLANTIHAAGRVPNAELAAATALIDLARSSQVLLPMSAGHMSETCKWTDRDRRYQLALTILELSRGWQMRDPLELRRFEIRAAVGARYKQATLEPLSPFTLEPGAIHGPSRGAESLRAPPHFPEEFALNYLAQTSICATFDTMLDAESVEIDGSPGWVNRVQGFTDWLAAQPRGSGQLRHVRTDAFFISDLLGEIPEECHRAGITPDEMSDWVLRRSRRDVGSMPSLGVFREAMREKLLNPGTRWESNDLTDLMYLTCAAGYADHVVAERSMAGQMTRGLARLGRPLNVSSTLADAMASLG